MSTHFISRQRLAEGYTVHAWRGDDTVDLSTGTDYAGSMPLAEVPAGTAITWHGAR